MKLRFQPPADRDVAGWTLIWMLLTPIMVPIGIISGDSKFLIATILAGGLSIGLWTGFRVCGFLLLGIFVLSGIGIISQVCREMRIDWVQMARLYMSSYFVFLILKYIRKSQPSGACRSP